MKPRQRRIRSRRQWAAHRAAVARRAARAWAFPVQTTSRDGIFDLIALAAGRYSVPFDRIRLSPRALRRYVRVVRGGVRYDPATGRPMAPPK